ncbi:hypothetical protein ITJ57_00070 [Plantibacter sp. VKM Ac-2880]|uniref:hypothetical protein n=1 Tax=Plantibacter sp. VKM Ac-2880 TaxID=2783827 RepID=UPI00188EE2CD|nr:hypothetical protein [Plantibacter sp. VKM Ac-2880]MBF4567145.1 hypothetical protein [Plantibacter sp. VKM Ac-2880]
MNTPAYWAALAATDAANATPVILLAQAIGVEHDREAEQPDEELVGSRDHPAHEGDERG